MAGIDSYVYEKNPPLVDYPLEALMMAFMLDASSNAEDIKEECETHIPIPSFTVDEFYETQGEYGRIPAINRINQGFAILNHADHTNINVWGVGSGAMTLSDIDSLTNGSEQSVMYSIGCYSAAIEYDCCAERFLNNPTGGGVSYIGNSRYGWYVEGDATKLGGDLDEEFYISLFSRGLYNLGKAHADAKDQWVDDTGGLFIGPYYKYTILELNLLGDPEMPIWTDSISETDATHLGTIPLGASEFTVTVTETDGTPIEGALVCCMMDDFSVYEKGYTDTSGEATIVVSPVHDGTMWVTASKHNYFPYEGFATVAGQDTTAPATVTDLIAVAGSTGEVYLTWTAPGDDGTTGIASQYDIRYVPQANGPIDSESKWLGATQVTGEPTPSVAGTPESMTVGGLVPGSSYYFALKTADEVPNWSGLSNSPLEMAGQDEYTLTVNTVGNGAVVKDPDQSTYVYNTIVQLTAQIPAGALATGLVT